MTTTPEPPNVNTGRVRVHLPLRVWRESIGEIDAVRRQVPGATRADVARTAMGLGLRHHTPAIVAALKATRS